MVYPCLHIPLKTSLWWCYQGLFDLSNSSFTWTPLIWKQPWGGGVARTTVSRSTSVVKIQVSSLTYMPSSSGSTRSLTCGCSSASCCTIRTYEKPSGQTLTQTLNQVSSSSPNLNTGVSYAENSGVFVPGVGSTETYSAPILSSISSSNMRIIHANELALQMTHCPMGRPVGPLPVIIDCRPFTDYNRSHIRGALHINCSDEISRRHLLQGKITVLDLISSHQSKDTLRDFFTREIVIYDESTWDPDQLSSSQPLHVVLESLRREGREAVVLQGKLFLHLYVFILFIFRPVKYFIPMFSTS